MDALREALHLVEHAIDLGHDVLSVHEYRRICTVPEGDVQDRAVFGFVYPVAVEHFFDGIGEIALMGDAEPIAASSRR